MEFKDSSIIVTEFLKKLFSKNSFNKEEFFSEEKNFKILLLIKLSKKTLIQKVIKYMSICWIILRKIKVEILKNQNSKNF